MKSYFKKAIFLLGDSWSQLPRITVSFMALSILDLVGIGIIGPFLGIVFGGVESLPTTIVDALSLKDYSHSGLVTLMAITLIVIYGIKSVFGAIIMKSVITFSQNQQVRIRKNLITSYQNMPYSKMIQRNSSDYVNAIQMMVPTYANLVMLCLQALGDSIAAIVIIVFLAWTNPYAFGFLVTITAVGLICFDLFVRKKMTAAGRHYNESAAAIVRHTNESLRGFKEIRVLKQEHYFNTSLVNSASTFAASQSLINFFSMLPKYIFEMIIIIFVAGMSIAASHMVSDPITLIPTLGVFGMASIRMIPLARSFSLTLSRVRYAKDTVMKLASDLEEIKHEASSVPAQNTSFTPDTIDQVQSIKLDNISYRYPGAKITALNKISLVINGGEHIGIVGTSGAGKTTLVDTLLGLLTPSEGQIQVNGRDITNNPEILWKNVAYLPQEIFIIDGTVAQNIALGIAKDDIDQKQLLYAVSQAQLDAAIADLPYGIDTNLGEDGAKLSGGQRQRIALARAFYFNRNVLVLDEATSSLDIETEAQIIDYLKNLKAKVTIISITHRAKSLEHCDRVLTIRNGQLQ
ncbi:ABC transporter ATP-binding protein/permease [Alphaproteobacteria bacterium]|nr:ABC transporter ATP-binding protein/permease [Alphaproteobacteria bacterium]